MATAALIGSMAVLASGCSLPGDRNRRCAEALERAALTVDEVVSAEYECSSSFGNPQQTGTIVLAVQTQEEATPVIEEIYRAFAADPEIDDSWMPSPSFHPEDGEPGTFFDDRDLGFNGEPVVLHMREKYGIDPTPSP